MRGGAHDDMTLSRKQIYRRGAGLAALLLIQVVGVAMFDEHGSAVRAFQPYYAKSWLDGVVTRSTQSDGSSTSLLASVGLLGNPPMINETSVDDRENAKAIGVPVLIYHGVLDVSDDTENVSYERFKEHMYALKEAGYRAIPLDEFDHFMSGAEGLPEKSFLLTFDDGRRDSFYPVDPILEALDFHATIFVITGRDDSTFHLDKKELTRMAASGRWDIQSHGHDDHDLVTIGSGGETGHFVSDRLWIEGEQRQESVEEMQQRVSEDMHVSRERIEEMTRRPVYAFAFPFGDYGQESKTIPNAEEVVLPIAERSFEYLFFQTWQGTGEFYNYPKEGGGATLVKRIKPLDTWSGRELVAVLEEGAPKAPRYADLFTRGNKGWVESWGEVDVQDKKMTVSAAKNTTGAEVYLGGTSQWNDYLFKAHLAEPTDAYVGLVAGYQDTNNYVTCSFGPESVQLVRMQDGERIVLGYAKASTTLDIAIRYSEGEIACRIGDNEVVEWNTESDLENGGIGVKVWKEEVGVARVVLKSIFVQEARTIYVAKQDEDATDGTTNKDEESL